MSMLAHQLAESRASQYIPLPLPRLLLTWGRLPCQRAGLTTQLEANNFRGFPQPGLPCPPSGGVTLLRSSHPAPPAPWKSSEAQKRWGKFCPATGSLPPSRCGPASPSCPWEVLFCFRVTLLALPTLGKCPAASKKTGQHCQPSGNTPQQCPSKPCPAIGSTPSPWKRK